MTRVGRPLKFKTVEEIKPLIESYFNNTPKEEWTITGLALALDTSRQTLINLEGRGEFFDTIKRAKDIVENGYEVDLKKHGRTGTIFALKNFDWKDKNETDITTGGEKINLNVINYGATENDNNSTQLPTERLSDAISNNKEEI